MNRTSAWKFFTASMAVMMVAMGVALVPTGNAQAVACTGWSDNFTPSWITIDSGGNSTHLFQNNRYELHTEGTDITAGYVISYVNSSGSDYVMQARIQRMEEGDQFVAYLVARADTSSNAYVIATTSGPTSLWFGKMDNGALSYLTPSNHIEAYDPSDYQLKFEVLGTTLRGKAWTYGAAEPADWQIECTDSSYSSGFGGVFLSTNRTADPKWNTVQVAYKEVSMTCSTGCTNWSDSFFKSSWVESDSGGNSTHVFQNNRYELHTEGDDTTPGWVLSYVSSSGSDYVMQARIQRMQSGDKFCADLLARLDVGGNAYVLVTNSVGERLWFGRLTGTVFSFLTPLEEGVLAAYDPADYQAKFAVYGNRLYGKAWTYGAEEPDWQIEYEDTSGSPLTSGPGAIFLTTNRYADPKWNTVQVAFKEVSMTCLSSPVETGYWDIQTVPIEGNGGHWSSIAIDSENNPHISFWDWGSASLKYASYDGATWNIETVDSGGVGKYSSLALDSKDNPHISYFDYTHTTLKYAADNGTAWNVRTVDSDAGQYTSLALDSDAHPHIGYQEMGGDRYGRLKYAMYNGTAWNTEFVDSTYGTGSYVSLALDSSGVPHISYSDDWKYNLNYASFNGSGWDIEVSAPGEGRGFNSLALDKNDHPHIGYYTGMSTASTYLKYASNEGTGWVSEIVDMAGDVGIYASLALDSDDNPRIAYGDAGLGNIKYASYDSGTWNIETVDSSRNADGFTSLALDNFDQPHISYMETIGGSTHYLKYAHFMSAPKPATITLTALPYSIEADGTSTSTLTATVGDQYGDPIADGTDVVFITSKGTVGSTTITKHTSGGIATATLTSEDSTHVIVADVSATVNGILKTIAVFFTPLSAPPITENQTETVTGSETITDTSTGGSITIEGTGPHTITTVQYGGNPGGTTPSFKGDASYYDVHVDNTLNLNSITIQFSPATESTVIYYSSGTDWLAASDQAYAGGIVTVTVGPGTTPSLSDLSGLFFGSGEPSGTAPIVINVPATSIMATSAILHGNLTDDGGAATTVIIYGGTIDGGTPPSRPGNWTRVENIGVRPEGAFSLGITGLNPNTKYYYRCYATSTGGTTWATESASFTTQADLGLWRNYWAGPGKDWFWFSSGRP